MFVVCLLSMFARFSWNCHYYARTTFYPAQDLKWVVSSFSEHRRMQRCKDDEGNLWCSPLRLFSCLPPNPPSGATHSHTTCISLCTLYCLCCSCEPFYAQFHLGPNTLHFTVLHFSACFASQTHSILLLSALHLFVYTNFVYKELVQLCKHLKLRIQQRTLVNPVHPSFNGERNSAKCT